MEVKNYIELSPGVAYLYLNGGRSTESTCLDFRPLKNTSGLESRLGCGYIFLYLRRDKKLIVNTAVAILGPENC